MIHHYIPLVLGRTFKNYKKNTPKIEMYNKYSVTVNQTFIVVLKYYFETEIIAKLDTTAKKYISRL